MSPAARKNDDDSSMPGPWKSILFPFAAVAMQNLLSNCHAGKCCQKQNGAVQNGVPKDVGDAVVFLASEAASFITGQTIYVDGGLFTQAPWPYNPST